MSEDVPILGIPALRENPFKARPLERGQSDLLVARDEISARWSRFLRNRNARMILLIGERGSGRSSLMRCVSEETSRSVHLDMFPTGNHAHSILNELFVTLIGFDVPSSTQELASRLVSATEEIEGPIPLISLDFSNVDGKNLSEIMSNLIAPLERLNAVVVVALSTEQRAQWPNNLVNRFDHNDVIQPLDRQHVKELCELRIAKSSKVSWDLPDKALDYIMEETKGSPYKVMRLMRNMVDEERANPREMKYEEPEPQNFQEEITQIEQDQEEEPEPEVFEKVFDLDLEKLEAPPESFEAIPRPLPSMGAFGALAARNRQNKQHSPRFDKKTAKREVAEPDGVDANHLWVAEDSHASLIQEKVEQIVETVDEFVPEEDPIVYHEQPNVQPSGDVEGLFGQLLEAIGVPEGLGVAELLAAIRRPVIGQKESNPLDVQTLRSLSKSEAILVEVGSDREFSPSDARLQDQLNVRRARMSQMCNRLYRGGILSVQQKGRTRMFKLTNDARAQLVAWGMMEASI